MIKVDVVLRHNYYQEEYDAFILPDECNTSVSALIHELKLILARGYTITQIKEEK